MSRADDSGCGAVRTVVLSVVLVVSAGTFLPAQHSAPGGVDAPVYAHLDEYFQRHLSRLNLPGAVLAVVEGQELVHVRGFGETHAGGGKPTERTPFFIGSLTKSFTAVAILQLAEDGRVALDAPARRYLPWFRVADPQASGEITVRHLLNQTSGLPQIVGMRPLADFDPRPGATKRQAEALTDLTLSQSVGSAFEYSNMNYNLLGLIVEAVTGDSYGEYVHKRIFRPLGMDNSYASHSAARADGLALGHRFWFGWPVSASDLPVPVGSLPSGQLISSAQDMARYAIAHLNGGRIADVRLLSAESAAELHRPAAAAGAMGVDMGSYAMGWFVEETAHGTVISHHGTVPNFFAFMALLPECRRGMVVLVNGNHLVWDVALQDICMNATSFLAGAQPTPASMASVVWGVRGALLIPLLQLAGIVVTLRRIRQWRRKPRSRPTAAKRWLLHVVLPAVPNLVLGAAAVALLAMRMVRFMELFLPDLTWLTMVSGSVALLWLVVRSYLVLSVGSVPNVEAREATVAASGEVQQ